VLRANATKSAKVIQVIETVAIRGTGTEKDPVRCITQYWDLEGNFLAENDVEHCRMLADYEANALKEAMVL